MALGGAPALMSQTAASIAVLPAPMITKWRGSAPSRGPQPSCGKAFGGSSRTTGATPNRGAWVDGTDGLRCVASTTFLRT